MILAEKCRDMKIWLFYFWRIRLKQRQGPKCLLHTPNRSRLYRACPKSEYIRYGGDSPDVCFMRGEKKFASGPLEYELKWVVLIISKIFTHFEYTTSQILIKRTLWILPYLGGWIFKLKPTLSRGNTQVVYLPKQRTKFSVTHHSKIRSINDPAPFKNPHAIFLTHWPAEPYVIGWAKVWGHFIQLLNHCG